MSERRKRRLLLSSTRAFYREARRTPGYSLLDFVHGYVYSRWPYRYIGAATGARPMPLLVRPIARVAA